MAPGVPESGHAFGRAPTLLKLVGPCANMCANRPRAESCRENLLRSSARRGCPARPHAGRQVPYDGGREIFGGTPFAFQLDRNGNPSQPYAAYKKLDNGARVVVMAEGMASLFLGSPDAVRLQEDSVNPGNTKWWGKDS